MSTTKGYYSIIQYCPDASRLEAVNVGVVLFCPDVPFLEARFARRRTRITQLFGKQDWDFVTLQQQAIAERLAAQPFQKLEDLEAYIARRANAIILTPSRPMKVEDPAQDLTALLQRLVGSAHGEAQPKTRVSAQLAQVFECEGVAAGLQRNVTVHPPALPKPVKAPFAYRNGKLNLIEPMQFEGHNSDSVFRRASVAAVEGEFLSAYKDPEFGDVGLVVVANFGPDQSRDQGTVETILRKHNVPMYTFDRLGGLIEDIRLHRHPD